MSDLEQSLGRRFARLDDEPRRRAARALAAVPPADAHAVRPVGSAVDFDALHRGFAALEPALDALPAEPSRVLDLGTGTGLAAFAVARRFPGASVVGSDIAEEMLAQAREATPPELADRVRFEAADAARLPFPPGSFDLVVLANMIPFFDELERVVAPGGHVLFSFSGGPQTPIWVPSERLREELGRRGFTDFADFTADPATAFLARKGGVA